jgi:uncharacterized protein (TIGR00255 family)
MLYSMTGYGRAEQNTDQQRIAVEIRSINSKSLDLRIRLASAYQSKEIELRKRLGNALLRGKIDVTITIEDSQKNDHAINREAFDNYYKGLLEIATFHNLEKNDLLNTVMRLPGVVVPNTDTIEEETWNQLLTLVDQAVDALQSFRQQEGAATHQDIVAHIQQIEESLSQVNPKEQERIDKIKTRLLSSLEDLQLKGKVDENRLEQEMIYYLDKFDLNEEKMRLEQHCHYFREELHKDTPTKGKKLGFILQEMGREINTLGSKANSASIQRLVIQMKNHADKIKEQLANIL